MLRRLAEIAPERREKIRGGMGKALAWDYLKPGEMAGILASSRITLEPGASIGTHLHPHEEELYLVLEGHGTGILDEVSFAVGPGDAYVCTAGHRHGLVNSGEAPLTFFAVLTRGE